jgi:hypothetical protein
MSFQDENIKFLIDNGYKEYEYGFELRYYKDNYGAMNIIKNHEVINMPHDILVDYHNHFMERASNKEIF